MQSKEMLNLLPRLSQPELREVAARAAALCAGPAPARNGKADTARVLYDAVAALFAARRGTRLAPYDAFVRGKGGAALRKHADDLRTYIKAHLRPRGRLDEDNTLAMLLGLLYNILVAEGRPLTPNVFCAHLGRVPEVVEAQFPGYLASGLLPVVLHPRRL